MDFSKVVMNRLYDLKMSKGELADELELDVASVQRKMKGTVSWTEAQITKACEILKIKIEFKEIS